MKVIVEYGMVTRVIGPHGEGFSKAKALTPNLKILIPNPNPNCAFLKVQRIEDAGLTYLSLSGNSGNSGNLLPESLVKRLSYLERKPENRTVNEPSVTQGIAYPGRGVMRSYTGIAEVFFIKLSFQPLL